MAPLQQVRSAFKNCKHQFVALFTANESCPPEGAVSEYAGFVYIMLTVAALRGIFYEFLPDFVTKLTAFVTFLLTNLV